MTRFSLSTLGLEVKPRGLLNVRRGGRAAEENEGTGTESKSESSFPASSRWRPPKENIVTKITERRKSRV